MLKNGDYGKTITLEFTNDEGDLSWAFYSHLSEISVELNQQVKEGDDMGRTGTTGHEIVGHGVASANKVFGVDNNTRAIRVDNLIRRVMGITTFRDEHGGAKIVNPNTLP